MNQASNGAGRTCLNCEGSRPLPLNSVDYETGPIAMSDAQFMRYGRATGLLCPRCACISIHYSPEDCLRRYFEDAYDVSDQVQNNLIVADSRVVTKRSRVEGALFEHLSGLPPDAANCLEVACGQGHLLKEIKARHPGWRCTGVDPSVEGHGAAAGQPIEGLTFLRGFFDEAELPKDHFDLVIAHGLLNRSPVLSELERINSVAKTGALVSLELLELENSHFAPHIWDHAYMYTRAALADYLAHAGLEILQRVDCGSAWHYLCRKTAAAGRPEDFRTSDRVVEATLDCFQAHERWWLQVLLNLNARPVAAGTTYLFGAGIYNAVLVSLAGEGVATAVIDETKAGSVRLGLPVIGLETAAERGGTVLVCARPSYLDVIRGKLGDSGLVTVVLNPVDGLGAVPEHGGRHGLK